METLCTDPWHVNPTSFTRSFGTPEPAQSEITLPITDVIFPSELKTLPIINPPSWLYIGKTGYLSLKREITAAQRVEGKFLTPDFRWVFIKNEMIIWQRWFQKSTLMAGFINYQNGNIADSYQELLEASKREPTGLTDLWGWHEFKKYPEVEFPSWLSVDQDEFLVFSGPFDKTLERTQCVDPLGRKVFIFKNQVYWQRWKDLYVLYSLSIPSEGDVLEELTTEETIEIIR